MSPLFWMGAAAMIIVAVAVIVVPLWRGTARAGERSHEQVDVALYRERRDELKREWQAGLLTDAEYQQVQSELDQQLLVDTQDGVAAPVALERRSAARWPVAAVLVLVPIVAIGLYTALGGFNALPSSQPASGPHDMQAMVQSLEDRLAQQPNDGRGWLMLGRSYTVLDRPQDAVHALSRARRLLGDTPTVLIAYARALAATRNRPSLLGRPAKLIEQAIEQAPNNPAALWLSGLAAIERGDYATAERRWQRLLSQQDADSPIADRVRQGLATIRTLDSQGAAPGRRAAAIDDAGTAPAATGAIAVSVRLADALKGRAQPGDTVYVFARAIGGPPMPLAVVRRQVADLPLTVTLDDGDAMMPGRTISGQKTVEIVARVSKSGRPTAQPGDLQAAAQAVAVGQQTAVSLTINSVVE